jgi:hypothetical protein
MLEGTDLSSAYGLISAQSGPSMFEEEAPLKQQQHVAPPPKPVMQSKQQMDNNPIMQQVQQIAAMQQQQQQQQQKQPMPTHSQQQAVAPSRAQPQYDANIFNRQFEQEQRYVRQQQQQQQQQQVPAYYMQQAFPQEPSYLEKMANKKKEVLKFLQSAMIIVFALALHVVIDFVLKHYLQMYDLSYEKELLIRVAYPLGILFIAWNIITYLK